MKKLILILMMVAGSLFSQNYYTDGDYKVDLDMINLYYNGDTLKGCFVYKEKTNQLMLNIDMKKEYEYISNVFISFVKFENIEDIPITTGITKNNLVLFFENLAYLNFFKKLENIQILTKKEFIILECKEENLVNKVLKLMVSSK